MGLQRAIIITALWLAFIAAGCTCGVRYLLALNLPPAQLKSQAELWGGVVSVLSVIGCTLIWTPVAVRFRKERLGRGGQVKSRESH
jgi:hypothetical protein